MQTQLKFQPFSSLIDASFWNEIAKRKINNWKLETEAQPILGQYCPSKHEALAPRFSVNLQSFSPRALWIEESAQHDVYSPGDFLNTNTIEGFKSMNKLEMLYKAGKKILDAITDGSILNDPSILNYFNLLSFSDLKQHKYFYWFCFPAIISSRPINILSVSTSLAEEFSPEINKDVDDKVCQFRSNDKLKSSFFVIKIDLAKNFVSIHSLLEWESLVVTNTTTSSSSCENAGEQGNEVVLYGFVDSSPLLHNPGWALRNYLAMINIRWNVSTAKIVAFKPHGSILFHIKMQEDSYDVAEDIKYTGWELNKKGIPGPRVMDLGSLMNPSKLAAAASSLNLRLMRWRALPTLDIDLISSYKCLLLGAGTLGCAVSRSLLAWGFTHITFVDNGRVSYSNPVRQSLYTMEDSINKSPKAATAARKLREIYADVVSAGHHMSIPMPGHPAFGEREVSAAVKAIESLDQLIQDHDVLFLLTDTRESRWLPTLIATTHNKLVMNVALGFDSYLVMRHCHENPSSMSSQSIGDNRLGCYFCNDVVAPENSMRKRTLDQQCTVTRPGLAPVAGSLCVEMLVSLLHHPEGVSAPADAACELYSNTVSPLGIIPHQIRGFIKYFHQVIVQAKPFANCTACSPAIVEEYKENGVNFVLKAMNDPVILENITGLTALKLAVEDVDVEWSDSEGEGLSV